VHHLALCWASYKGGHISFRQFRIVMAAHEMAERRVYTAPSADAPTSRSQPKRQPRYGLCELKSLVGGRGSKSADAALSTDLRHLTRLGLITITERSISFASSIDQLRVDDTAFFWEMFDKLDHKRRSVPVPRRVLRALAGGFNSGTAAVVLATLIRSMFWRRDAQELGSGSRGRAKGAYRVDGRTKRDWIAEVFGVTPRTVTAGRQRLIELGWLIPLDTPQWMLNRYGSHDAINTDWSASNDGGGSSSPSTKSEGGSSSPDQNKSPSPSVNQEPRKLRPTRAGPSGVCRHPGLKGRRQPSGAGVKARPRPKPPNIRDIQSADLADTGRLLQLYEQAIGIGVAKPGEAGRLEFLALAERARMHGRRAGALLFYLLRERKAAYITQCAEDEARRRLKEHLYGVEKRRARQDVDAPAERWGGEGEGAPKTAPERFEPTEDDKIVLACLRVGKKHHVDPFRIARKTKGWARDRWDQAHADYEQRHWERHCARYMGPDG